MMRYWTDEERKRYAVLGMRLAEAVNDVNAAGGNPFTWWPAWRHKRRCEAEYREARLIFNTRALHRQAAAGALCA